MYGDLVIYIFRVRQTKSYLVSGPCTLEKSYWVCHLPVVSASGRVGELVVGEKVPSLSCRVGQLSVVVLS